MRFVFISLEMNHAIDAGERRASTLVAMGVEFLLRKDITARLEREPSQQTTLAWLSHSPFGISKQSLCDSPRIGTTP